MSRSHIFINYATYIKSNAKNQYYHNFDHMDQVIEVNGINVEGQTPNHVLNILREAEHTITFKLIPNVGQ